MSGVQISHSLHCFQVDIMDANMCGVSDDISAFKRDINALKGTLEVVNSEIDVVKSHIEGLKSAQNAHASQMKTLNSEKDVVKSAQNAHASQMKTLGLDIQHVKTESRDRIQELDSNGNEMNTGFDNTRRESDNRHDNLLGLKDRLRDTLFGEIGALKVTLDVVSSEIDVVKSNMEGVQSAQNVHASKMEILILDLQRVETTSKDRIQEVESNLEKIVTGFDQLKREADNLNNNALVLQERLDRDIGKISGFKGALEVVDSELKIVKSTHGSQIKSLEADMEQVKKESERIQEFESKCNNIITSFADNLSKNMLDFKTRLDHYIGEISALKGALKVVDSELEIAKADLNETKSVQSTHEAQIKTTKADIKQVKKESERIQELESKYNEIRTSFADNLKKNMLSLQERIDREIGELVPLKGALEVVNRELENAKADLMEFKSTQNTHASQMDNIEVDVEQVKKESERIQDVVSKYKEIVKGFADNLNKNLLGLQERLDRDIGEIGPIKK